MIQTFWEKTRKTNSYTGYYFNAPELCRTKNYILHHNNKPSMKVTNHLKHIYVQNSPLDDLKKLKCNISALTETSFNSCLARWYQNSLKLSDTDIADINNASLLTWTLSGHILVSGGIEYFSKDEMENSGAPELFGSNLQFTFKSKTSATLEISNHSLVTHSLSLENINLNVHDNSFPSIICASTCSISGGNHKFYNNFLGDPSFYGCSGTPISCPKSFNELYSGINKITNVGVYDLQNINYWYSSPITQDPPVLQTLCIYSDTIRLTNGDYNFSNNNLIYTQKDEDSDSSILHTSIITSNNLFINDSSIIFNNNQNDTRTFSKLANHQYLEAPFTTIICNLNKIISTNSTLQFTNNLQRYLIYQSRGGEVYGTTTQMNINDCSLICDKNQVLDTLITGYDISINTNNSSFSNNANLRTDPNNSLYLNISKEVSDNDPNHQDKTYIMGPQYANGGIISSTNGLSLSGNLTFIYNNVKGAGSVISANQINLTNGKRDQNILFNNNTTNILYSTVYSYDTSLNKGKITLQGTHRFTDNSSGGAIKTTGSVYLLGDDSYFNFENNTSYDNGAAIYSYSPDNSNQTILIEGTAKFEYNESKKSGGAIYGRNLNINATKNSSISFNNNSSYLFGGGAHVEQLQFVKNDIIDVDSGGANIAFIENTSYYAGGGLVITNISNGTNSPSDINLLLANINFTKNTTKYFSDWQYDSCSNQPNNYFINYDGPVEDFSINTNEDFVKFLTFKSGTAILLSDISLYIPIWIDYFQQGNNYTIFNGDRETAAGNYTIYGNGLNNFYPQSNITVDEKGIPHAINKTHVFTGGNLLINGIRLVMHNFFPSTLCSCLFNRNEKNEVLPNTTKYPAIDKVIDICKPVNDNIHDDDKLIKDKCSYTNADGILDVERLKFLNPDFNLIDRSRVYFLGQISGFIDLCGNSTFFNGFTSLQKNYVQGGVGDDLFNLNLDSLTITKSLLTAINVYNDQKERVFNQNNLIIGADKINFINNQRPFVYSEILMNINSDTSLNLHNNSILDKSIITIQNDNTFVRTCGSGYGKHARYNADYRGACFIGYNLTGISIQNNTLISVSGVIPPLALISVGNGYNIGYSNGICRDNSISIFYNKYSRNYWVNSSLNFINNSGSVIIGGGGLDISGSSLLFSKNNTGKHGAGINITGDISITKSNLYFDTNTAIMDGGAIWTSHDLNINDSSLDFRGNISISGDGGAIYSGRDINLIDSSMTFMNNTSTTGLGGAIATNILHLSGGISEFRDNTAEKGGGAIYSNSIITDNTNAKYTFTGNQSNSGAGGAIFTDTSLHIIADNLTFKSNISDSSGGAIYSKDDITLDSSSTFTDNSSGTVGGAIAGININLRGNSIYEFITNTSKMDGGAIHADGSLSINTENYIYFNKNTSTAGLGGAIAASHISNMSSEYLKFTENHAKAGGAIYTDTDLFIHSETEFYNNSADSSGGAIYSKDDITLDSSLTFTDNSSGTVGGAITSQNIYLHDGPFEFRNNTSSADGGAIYSKDNIILDGSSIFANNQSTTGFGGAIATNTLHLSGGISEFNYNTAEKGGGAIYSESIITDNTNAEYTFTGNQSNSGAGGAIFTDTSLRIIADNLTFKSNISDSSGGAIYSKDNIILDSFRASTSFTDNSSGTVGGAITGQNIYLRGGPFEFSGNTSSADGGAIYSKDNIILDGSSIFANNQSTTGFGGAIATNTLHLYYGTSEFRDNTAEKGGGAIYSESIITDNSNAEYTFTGNHTTGAGGAIFTDTSLHIIADNLTFKSNISDSSGGAIYSKDDITLDSSSTFTDNSSGTVGGAITGQNIDLHGGPFEFRDNTSSADGGAIWAYPRFTLDSNSIFNNNQSTTGFGGAIATNTLHLSGGISEFRDNTAEKGGGAIYSESIITDNTTAEYTFTGNKSNSGAGGAIFTDTSLHIIADALTFESNNSDSSGGAIYSKDDITLDSSSTFTDNSSGTVGGAISAQKLILDGSSTFTNNRSDGSGGAIYITDLCLNTNTYTFNNNTSNAAGGAINIQNSIYLTLLDNSNASYLEMSGNSALDASDIWINTNTTSSTIRPTRPGFYKNVENKQLDLSNISLAGTPATINDFSLIMGIPGICRTQVLSGVPDGSKCITSDFPMGYQGGTQPLCLEKTGNEYVCTRGLTRQQCISPDVKCEL